MIVDNKEAVIIGIRDILLKYVLAKESKVTEDITNALNEVGISSINSETGDYKTFGDIIDEVSKKWKSLDLEKRDSVSLTLSGKSRASDFKTLMKIYLEE
jgi:hypothetical protein